MSRKKSKQPINIENVEIIDVAAEGKSVAKIDEKVVFLPYGAPGDVVNIRLGKQKRNYAEGYITEIVSPSPVRCAPKCSHFTICGGCKWQHLPYDFQLQFKQKQVKDAFERIAKVEIPEINPILGSKEIWEYRNKLEFTFSSKRWLTFEEINSGKDFDMNAAGFHIPGSFDKVLDIDTCHLQIGFANDVRNFIKNHAISKSYSFYNAREQQGFLRNMIVRTSSIGQIMLIVVFGYDDRAAINELLSAVMRKFPEITSLQLIINEKVNDSISDLDVELFAGVPWIDEEMEGLKFRISPKSFYQTNSKQAYELYKVVRNFADLSGKELVYDLYTGTGTIANFIASKASKVVGIEYVEDAIKDAQVNSDVNGIKNTDFFAGDMKDVLTDEFVAKHGSPEVMVIDPPRAGMHQNVIDVILRAAPRLIVYVSCNPATQARDLALLDKDYKVMEIQPVDMFPHTHHVENVVKLVRRQALGAPSAESTEL